MDEQEDEEVYSELQVLRFPELVLFLVLISLLMHEQRFY